MMAKNTEMEELGEVQWLFEAPGGRADFAKIANPEGFEPREF